MGSPYSRLVPNKWPSFPFSFKSVFTTYDHYNNSSHSTSDQVFLSPGWYPKSDRVFLSPSRVSSQLMTTTIILPIQSISGVNVWSSSLDWFGIASIICTAQMLMALDVSNKVDFFLDCIRSKELETQIK